MTSSPTRSIRRSTRSRSTRIVGDEDLVARASGSIRLRRRLRGFAPGRSRATFLARARRGRPAPRRFARDGGSSSETPCTRARSAATSLSTAPAVCPPSGSPDFETISRSQSQATNSNTSRIAASSWSVSSSIVQARYAPSGSSSLSNGRSDSSQATFDLAEFARARARSGRLVGLGIEAGLRPEFDGEALLRRRGDRPASRFFFVEMSKTDLDRLEIRTRRDRPLLASAPPVGPSAAQFLGQCKIAALVDGGAVARRADEIRQHIGGAQHDLQNVRRRRRRGRRGHDRAPSRTHARNARGLRG